jgi:hypothetical protein
MSDGCTGIEVVFEDFFSVRPTGITCTQYTRFCFVVSPEVEEVIVETCRGP